MLGFAPSDIEKPADPTAFLASVSNATNSFSALPTNYAVEVAPAWLFGGRKIRFADFSSNHFCHNVWQSLTLSAAIKRTDSLALTQAAFGLKTSLARGKTFGKSTNKTLEKLQKSLEESHALKADFFIMDSLYQNLLDQLTENDALKDSVERMRDRKIEAINQLEALKKQEAIDREAISKIRFDRTGFKLDLAAGLVIDYPGHVFDRGRSSKAGVWLTPGYEWEKGFSALGIARWLYNPDKIYALDDSTLTLAEGNIKTFDAGLRLVWSPVDRKFTFSAEAIYRSITAPKDVLASNWKFALNAEYRFKNNQSLNFSFGRDFDGTISRDGNVISMLSLFTGFGSEKPLTNKK